MELLESSWTAVHVETFREVPTWKRFDVETYVLDKTFPRRATLARRHHLSKRFTVQTFQRRKCFFDVETLVYLFPLIRLESTQCPALKVLLRFLGRPRQVETRSASADVETFLPGNVPF